MTRDRVAIVVGISGESYANYEYARAPLRYGMVCKLTASCELNPAWLATGEGPMDIQVCLPSAESLSVSPRDLFTAVFDEKLAAKVKDQVEGFFAQPHSFLRKIAMRAMKVPRGLPITPQLRAQLEAALIDQVQNWTINLPDSELVEFMESVVGFADNLFAYKVFGVHAETSEVIEQRKLDVDTARSILKLKQSKPLT